jgi:hypothetical protein
MKYYSLIELVENIENNNEYYYFELFSNLLLKNNNCYETYIDLLCANRLKHWFPNNFHII